jgi:hypothetical protein
MASRYRDAAALGSQRANVIREVLMRPRVRPTDEPAPPADVAIRAVTRKH